MLCEKCGKNERYEYKGHKSPLCSDCLWEAFQELFAEADRNVGLTTHEADKPHTTASEGKQCRYCHHIREHALGCPNSGTAVV